MKNKIDTPLSCRVSFEKEDGSFVPIGVLTRYPEEKVRLRPNGKKARFFDYAFTYDTTYRGPSLPTLPQGKGPLLSEGLHVFFRNLIPDRKGRPEKAAIDVLSARGYEPSRFIALALLGQDSPGNLRFDADPPLPRRANESLSRIESIATDLNNALLLGRQPKCLVCKTASGDYEIATMGSGKRGNYIAKFLPNESDFYLLPSEIRFGGMIRRTRKQTTNHDLLENEYSNMLALSELLPDDKTAKCELKYVKGLKGEALIIQRDDRQPVRAYYDFCQLLGIYPEKRDKSSYKQIADYIRAHASGPHEDGICTKIEDIGVIYKRVIATALLGNGDTHLKNFSLRDEGGVFRPSPNYDPLSGLRYAGYDEELALAIGGSKGHRIEHLTPRILVVLAQDLGLLSKKPTLEEAHHVALLVKEVEDRAKVICDTLKTGDASLCRALDPLMDARFANERRHMMASIEKGRRRFLTSFPFALAAVFRNHGKKDLAQQVLQSAAPLPPEKSRSRPNKAPNIH